MARRRYTKKNYSGGKKKYGKPFRKKGNSGKHKKGTMIKYVYKGNRRVGAVKHSYNRRY